MAVQPFEFATANQIHFGVGLFNETGKFAAQLGERALLVSGIQNEYTEKLNQLLADSKVDVTQILVDSEPTIDSVQQALQLAKEIDCDLVVGFGGGSAIDTAKAAAILHNNPGELLDYLEVIGKGESLLNPSLPCIAIPTTAGTGAEVTRNAVISSPENRVKVSLRSPYILPRIALIDPELTLTLPPHVTASTGLDALTQVIEPYVSNKANPITDSLCKEGMVCGARSLRSAYFTGSDLKAREGMCITSLFGGLALANAKLGAVHGFAGVIGGEFHGPHGAICARLLPPVIEQNVSALRIRAPASPALKRFDEVAEILTGDKDARAEDGVSWIKELADDLSIPPLSVYGMEPEDILDIAKKSALSSSMKGNPIMLSLDELTSILESAL